MLPSWYNMIDSITRTNFFREQAIEYKKLYQKDKLDKEFIDNNIKVFVKTYPKFGQWIR